MKCPYCVEDIQAGAISCRHCRHDLSFFMPVYKTVRELTQQVQELTERMALLESSRVLPKPTPKVFNVFTQLKVGLIALVTQVFLGLLLVNEFFGGDLSALVSLPGFVIGPMVFGFWAGAAWEGRHAVAYSVWGLICGVGSMLPLFVTKQLTIEDLGGEVGGVVLMVIGAHLLTFLAGGLIGDWLESHRNADAGSNILSRRLAQLALGRDPAKDGTEGSKRLAQYIAAFAPLLTFGASVIASFMAYQSSVAAFHNTPTH